MGEKSRDQLAVKFEEYFQRNLPTAPSFHPYFEEALQWLLKAPGKRFRPLLILKVVEAFEPLLVDGAMAVAAGVELLHTYSLIHDDLPAMDNGTLRRGVPTLHRQFDEVTAILVGDGLNTEGFRLIATAPLSPEVRVRVIQVLGEVGGLGGMVLGQALDCYFEGRELSIGQLEELHRLKTGKLIAGALKIGAIISNQPQLEEPLFQFGLRLGLLFQIQDDLLDLQQEEVAGKSTGVDSRKNTFVTVLGAEEARNRADQLAEELRGEIGKWDPRLREKLGSFLEGYLFRHRNF